MMDGKGVLLPAVDSPRIEAWIEANFGDRMQIAPPLQLTDHVIETVEELTPEVILLSRFLPGDKPVAMLLLALREKHPHTRVILLVGELDDEGKELVELAISHGVFDLIIGKDPIPEDVLATRILHPSDYAAVAALRSQAWGLGNAAISGNKGNLPVGKFPLGLEGRPKWPADVPLGRRLTVDFFKGLGFKGTWPVLHRSRNSGGKWYEKGPHRWMPEARSFTLREGDRGNPVRFAKEMKMPVRYEGRDDPATSRLGSQYPSRVDTVPVSAKTGQNALERESGQGDWDGHTELRVVPARVVAVVGTKGGVGRTTVAVNLAVAAGRLGQKVALVDLCPDLVWATGRRMGLKGSASGLPGLLGGDGKEPEEAAELSHGVAVFSRGKGETIWIRLDRPLVADCIRRLERAYGMVVLDCPAPANDESTIEAVAQATDVYMVVDSADPMSLEAAAESIRALGLDKGGRCCLIENRHGKQSLPPNELLAYFNEDRGFSLKLAGIIQADFPAHSLAAQRGLPVAAASAAGARPWEKLVQELLGLAVQGTGRRSWFWRRNIANA